MCVSPIAGQSLAASSLFNVSDADGDALTYFIHDATPGGGHWAVNGTPIADNTVVALSANDLAHTVFVAGPLGSNDQVGMLAYDGTTYSGNTSFSYRNVAVSNHAPVVTIPNANVSATAGQSLTASSLFNVSDAEGDALTYFIHDATPGGGHWAVNGTAIADNTVVALSANELAHTVFVAGPAGSNDQIGVLAYDGHDYSGNPNFAYFHVLV